MDAVQFGRWIGERRRACGWRSQRTLVEETRHDPLFHDCGISEDFLARLESGHLAHPFRGAVRQRILKLAWLLCKTPRDVRRYLQAAELTELSVGEAELVQQLHEYVATPHTTMRLLLPPHPTKVVGRTEELRELGEALTTADICVVTGMPGIGKSTLAYEAIHRLVADERCCLRLFPDGIATFTGTGRRGISGLIALLNEIANVFQSSVSKTKSQTATAAKSLLFPLSKNLLYGAGEWEEDAETELADAIDRVRLALADKRVLLLLDGLEVSFPFRQALDVLLTPDAGGMTERGHNNQVRERRAILITTCYVLPPNLVTYHHHLAPLQPTAAHELLIELLGRPFSVVEQQYQYIEQICASVGYLPLAIEVAATALLTEGIPLPLLASCVAEHPLDRLLDGGHEISMRFSRAINGLDPRLKRRFALLSVLGTRSFGLECVAAMHVKTIDSVGIAAHGTDVLVQSVLRSVGHVQSIKRHLQQAISEVLECEDLPLDLLATTAADLGQLVRYSLLELVENTASYAHNSTSYSGAVRYSLHPLLHAYAQEHLSQLAIADRELGVL